MRSEIISWSSVEQEELNQKRQELARLQSELVEQELHLATLRAELSAFEEKYRRQVGVLHAELDEWKAKIAELVSKEEDTPEARSAAADARAQASQSYSEAHGEGTNTNEFSPTPELKKLYREVAKKVHPDYATDQADRNIRERLMADANRAYREGEKRSFAVRIVCSSTTSAQW